MTEARSKTEERINTLNKLRAESKMLEDGLRSMRLGDAQPGLEYVWLKRVLWIRQPERYTLKMPEGVEQEFYRYLQGRQDAVHQTMRVLEKHIDDIERRAEKYMAPPIEKIHNYSIPNRETFK